MNCFKQQKIQFDAESLSPASTLEHPPTDPDTDALPQSEKDVAPLSLLHHHKVLTRPVREWYLGIKEHEAALQEWFVVKVDHMKNFHYSAVFHEHLRVTLRRRDAAPSERVDQQIEHVKPQINECVIYIEREVKTDEVTVGCQPRKVPKLHGWWIVRFFRGNYSDGGGGGGVKSTASLSGTSEWRELSYSASDFLRCLEFDEGVISLWDLARVTRKWSKTRKDYDVARANCFWFANMVYAQLKYDWNGTYKESEGPYIIHMGRFSGLRILFNSVSWIRNNLTYLITSVSPRQELTILFLGWEKIAKGYKSSRGW